VYFPRRVIPMLPEKLSNGLCSLNPAVDRLVLVCDMVIAASGEIKAYQFYEAVMHSAARLTYDEVWGILSGRDPLAIRRRAPLVAQLPTAWASPKLTRFVTTYSLNDFSIPAEFQCPISTWTSTPGIANK
jgi:exoribonuclease R